MSNLTVEQYDTAERAALIRTPNRVVESCMAVAFNQEGYPTRIHSTEAAARYVDVMQDGRSEGTFEALLGGITPDEMTAIEQVAIKVADMTERYYCRRLAPRASLLRSLNVVRHIRALHPGPGASILEIGPGSGYVGALLLQLGYRYAATDIAQAFYIYQNHLLNAFAPGRVIELATDSRGFFDLQDIPAGHAVHVPWWKFVQMDPRATLAVNFVTCNHALCEMHPNALNYTVRVAADLLNGPGTRAFVFEGWGSTIRAPIWHAGRAFARAGFIFVHNDIHASILVRHTAEFAAEGHPRPAEGAPDGESTYHPPIFVNPNGRIGRCVLSSRDETKQAATGTLADLDTRLRKVVGRDDLATDDERFMRFVSDARR